mgnify:CR=1 FL=1
MAFVSVVASLVVYSQYVSAVADNFVVVERGLDTVVELELDIVVVVVVRTA